jgi:hypothetical protein
MAIHIGRRWVSPIAAAMLVAPVMGRPLAPLQVCAFPDAKDYTVGNRPQSVAAADLDGDLDVDLAVANALSDDVSILLDEGDGTFAAQVAYVVSEGPAFVATGDLDSDGHLDLVLANRFDISILLGNGDGTFAPHGMRVNIGRDRS